MKFKRKIYNYLHIPRLGNFPIAMWKFSWYTSAKKKGAPK